MLNSKVQEILSNKNLQIEYLDEKIKKTNEDITELSNQNKFNDPEYASFNKDLNELTLLKEKLIKLQKLQKRYDENQELITDESFAELAKEELNEITSEMNQLINDLEIYLTEPLKNDDKKAIVEIRPGVGGVEASLFAEELFRSYLRYCNTEGFDVEQLSLIYDDEGGIKESIFLLNNNGAFGKLRFESGVHRVQRVPVTESSGRIHTSTASVVVLPKIEEKDIEIKDSELRIDVYRSSGPGGQSVNTTDSAVRITHIPTGIVVSCQNGKSQHKNKEMAMSVLMSKLNQIEEEKRSQQEKNLRSSSIMGGDRSVKIRTYNFAQSRVTDHRVNISWYNLEEILNGEIGEVVKKVSKAIRSDEKDSPKP